MNFIYFWLISGEFKFNRECHQNFYYRDIMERLNAFLLINGASTKTIFCYFLWSVAYMHSWIWRKWKKSTGQWHISSKTTPAPETQRTQHSAARCPLSSLDCLLSSNVCHFSSVLRCPPSAAHCFRSSIICSPSSVLRPLPSAAWPDEKENHIGSSTVIYPRAGPLERFLR